MRSMLSRHHAPPQQFSTASEPDLEAPGTAYEDIINGYRQREQAVADASNEVRRNLEQPEGMRAYWQNLVDERRREGVHVYAMLEKGVPE